MRPNRIFHGTGGALLTSIILVMVTRSALAQGSRYAVQFFGTGTGQIDRIKIPIVSNMALNVGHDFTIEFWMRASHTNNDGIVYPGMNGDGWITGNIIFDRDIWGPGDFGDFGIAIGRIGTNSVVAFGIHNGDWGETIVGTNNVGDSQWHHVAIVRVESNGLMQIFVDGVLDASAYGPTGDVSYRVGRSTSYPESDPYIVLGAEKHDAGSEYPSFHGLLDELRIWNRALPPEQLLEVRARVTPPALFTNLVGYWRFEEGTNQTVRDSAFGYTGMLLMGIAGNGEWRSFRDNTHHAAPISFYEPQIQTQLEPDNDGLSLSWFGQQNLAYALQAKTDLGNTSEWSFVPNATNLTASESAIVVNISLDDTQRFFRVIGQPYR